MGYSFILLGFYSMSPTHNPYREKLHGERFKYDVDKYSFKPTIEALMGSKLDCLHEYLGDFSVFERKNDQSTLAHRVFYSNYEKHIKDLYLAFLSEVIKPIIGEDFYYQVIPTFRVGLPGNKFVGEYHKDSDYNHLGHEINFNLGLSGYHGLAALRTETFPGSKDFMLLESPYGSFFSFDHIGCLHGSDPNPNEITMTSFDFRISPSSLYYDSDAGSVNTGSKMMRGSYFSSEVI